ncbi:thiamine phosphate synthase [Limoniibacter endophyticus]|uniref:Thiamine phosphate synthase n=1 Tax=Limoniibacter endophyticus TaxID=1565040 RepID=A0A8J3DKL7_9HYPH|nr:thiamine phosphate synthase [Limoniibacter endophyticus]GHC76785.1 thiamine phosphate synthase [Limoniibacter endophyticus]
MESENSIDRCRVVLIAPTDLADDAGVAAVKNALSGGDVACVILPAGERGEEAFQDYAEKLVPVVQDAGAALMLESETRIVSRVKADGVHLGPKVADLADVTDRVEGRMMIGAGGRLTRDEALALGELRPDYVFLGLFGKDTTPEPYERNLTLARWWAEMVEVPLVVQGGNAVASVVAVAEAGADFVALASAVFAEGLEPKVQVAMANALLDEKAPRFEGFSGKK